MTTFYVLWFFNVVAGPPTILSVTESKMVCEQMRSAVTAEAEAKRKLPAGVYFACIGTDKLPPR